MSRKHSESQSLHQSHPPTRADGDWFANLPGVFEGTWVHDRLYRRLVAHLPPAPDPDGVHGDAYESIRQLAWLMSAPMQIYLTGDFEPRDWARDPMKDPSFRKLYDLFQGMEPFPAPSTDKGSTSDGTVRGA